MDAGGLRVYMKSMCVHISLDGITQSSNNPHTRLQTQAVCLPRIEEVEHGQISRHLRSQVLSIVANIAVEVAIVGV